MKSWLFAFLVRMIRRAALIRQGQSGEPGVRARSKSAARNAARRLIRCTHFLAYCDSSRRSWPAGPELIFVPLVENSPSVQAGGFDVHRRGRIGPNGWNASIKKPLPRSQSRKGQREEARLTPGGTREFKSLDRRFLRSWSTCFAKWSAVFPVAPESFGHFLLRKTGSTSGSAALRSP